MKKDNVVVSASRLFKKYGDVTAINSIDFSVRKQECFGFLGPNGAGKTTTIMMAACFLEPASGSVTVLGMDTVEHPRLIKSRVGLCPQEDNLDPDLSVFDNLRVFARYFDIPRVQALPRCEELLHFMGLYEKRDARIDELSGGMKRRLLVARCLLNRPSLIILDEPTTGLDPQARHQIWKKLQQLKQEGTTILLTTHYMEEAARLCDRLVIMDQGRVVVEGSPRELVKKHAGTSVIEIYAGRRAEDINRFLSGRGLRFEKTQTRFLVYGEEAVPLWPEISRTFGEESFILRMADLEDVFLKLTGREIRETQ